MDFVTDANVHPRTQVNGATILQRAVRRTRARTEPRAWKERASRTSVCVKMDTRGVTAKKTFMIVTRTLAETVSFTWFNSNRNFENCDLTSSTS